MGHIPKSCDLVTLALEVTADDFAALEDNLPLCSRSLPEGHHRLIDRHHFSAVGFDPIDVRATSLARCRSH